MCIEVMTEYTCHHSAPKRNLRHRCPFMNSPEKKSRPVSQCPHFRPKTGIPTPEPCPKCKPTAPIPNSDLDDGENVFEKIGGLVRQQTRNFDAAATEGKDMFVKFEKLVRQKTMNFDGAGEGKNAFVKFGKLVRQKTGGGMASSGGA